MRSQTANSRAFIGRSFSIFVARFFPALANFLAILLFSRNLSLEHYGGYSRFWVQLNMLVPFLCLGLHNLVLTYPASFVPWLAQLIKRKMWIAYLCWVVLVLIAFAALQLSYPDGAGWISALFLALFGIATVADSLLIVTEQFRTLIGNSILYSAGYLCAHFWVLKNGYNPVLLFGLLSAVVAVKTCISLVSLIGYFQHRNDTGAFNMTPATTRKLWAHLGFYDVIQLLSMWADKFIIALILGPVSAAYYYNGTLNIPFLPILLSAASSAALMQLAKNQKDDQHHESIALMNATGRLLSAIVFPICCFLLCYSREVIVLLLTDKYLPAVPIFMVSMAVLPVRSYSFTTILQKQHQGRIINIGATAELLLALVLMYPFFLIFGLPGVALSFVVSTYAQAAFYLFHTARLLHTSVLQLLPLRDWVMKLVVCGTFFWALHYLTQSLFEQKIILILGIGGWGVVTTIYLIANLKTERKYGHLN